MELIDRYLQSVKSALPRKQQADVVRELSDEILSQVEEREQTLGRRLTEDEQATLLKQMGHPWLLAARYRKQQYLISPAVFPIYWIALRLMLLLVLFGMSISAVALAATGQGLGAALAQLIRYPFVALSVFAWVTLVFVVVEQLQVKCDVFGKWDPRTLPVLSKSEQKHSMTESIAALIFGTIFGVWWLVGLKHQFLIFGPGVAWVHFGPVWQTIYPLFVVLVLAELTRYTLQFLRPAWDKAFVWFRLVFHALNLTVIYFLLGASELLVPSEGAGQQVSAMKQINSALHMALIVVAIIAVLQFARDIYRFLRSKHETRPAVASL